MNRRTLLKGLVAALMGVPRGHAQTNPNNPTYHRLAAEYSARYRGISLLVMVDGKTVFEDYPNGGSPTRAHELASGTKSFSGVMAIAAQQDGLLSLDEPASKTLTEWQGDPLREKITLRQLLNLTSGIPGGNLGRIPTYQEAVQSPAEAPPGTRFSYGPVPFQIFGEVMRRKLGGDPLAYLQRRIFQPIGLEYAFWRRGPDGNPHLPSGAFLTARNWARFGELVRQGGFGKGSGWWMPPCWTGALSPPRLTPSTALAGGWPDPSTRPNGPPLARSASPLPTWPPSPLSRIWSSPLERVDNGFT